MIRGQSKELVTFLDSENSPLSFATSSELIRLLFKFFGDNSATYLQNSELTQIIVLRISQQLEGVELFEWRIQNRDVIVFRLTP